MALAIGTPQVAPSQADVEAFVRRVIVDEEPAVALVSDVRELMFEASTYVLAELQKQVSAPAVEEAYRKMPLVPMLQSAKPSSSVSSRKETVKDTHAIQQPAESSRGLPDKLKGLKSKDEQGGPRCWHHYLSHGCKDPLKKVCCRHHHCMKCQGPDLAHLRATSRDA